MPILIDTCVFVDYLRKVDKAIEYIDSLETPPYISVITITELLTGARNKKEKEQIQILFDLSNVLEVSEEIAVLAGDLLNKYYKSHGVGLGDGLIAATAQIHNLEVATLNTKHFPMFEGLEKPY